MSENSDVLVLISVVLLLSISLVTKRSPLIIISLLSNALRAAFRRIFIRIGILKKGVGVESPIRRGGPNFWATVAHFFRTETLVDRYLKVISENKNIVLEINRTLFFKWIRPTDSCYLVQGYDIELAKEDSLKSAKVFHYNIPMAEMLEGNLHEYLYEDVHSSFIIRLFRGDDRQLFKTKDDQLAQDPLPLGPDDVCFHVMNKMRKTINDNIKMLSIVLSFIVSTFIIANIYYIDICGIFSWDCSVDNREFFSYEFDYTRLKFAAYAALLTLVLFFLIYMVEYKFVQRYNGRELDTFARNYLAELNTKLREADASVSKSIGFESEDDVELDSISTNMWFINLQWIAWRCFFIELFIRSIFYQIVRNGSYYMILVPLAFGAVLYLSILNLNGSVMAKLETLSPAFWLFLAIILWIYQKCFREAIQPVNESVNENGWIEFHRMKLEETTRKIVSRFIKEISNWRDRFRQRGGM